MIQTSIIIPSTIGGFMHLSRLMPNLSQEPDSEIIVVDNNSHDGTAQFMSNYDCTVKFNKTNMGFSKANNQGAKIAQGEYLLLLNNDTVVTKDFIAEMVKTFSIDPAIGIVGCLIYTMDLPHLVQHAGVCFTEDYVPYELGMEIPSIAPAIPKNDDRVSAVREVPSVTAACMMVKKSVYQELGGLDEGYTNGWEDTDLVLRAREKGYKVWYTGKTHIMHKHFGSIGRYDHETENRSRYDSIWVTTGRAKAILKGYRNG